MTTARPAKVENAAERKLTHQIIVDETERICVNCIWYEQYYRQFRTNLYGWTPTSTGYCLKRDEQRGAFRQPCRDFERPAPEKADAAKSPKGKTAARK